MKLQKQAFLPDTPQFGDCHRTAYAMVLGLDRDEVPHVFEGGRKDGHVLMRDWLKERDIVEIDIPMQGNALVKDVLESRHAITPDIPYILGGISRNDTNHSVAVFRGEIFDPSINDTGIVGPMSDGFYWLTYLVRLPWTPPVDPKPKQE